MKTRGRMANVGGSKGETAPTDDRLSETVFELCIKFLAQVFRQEKESNSPLIHFCGALEI
jgi:hypothetical protein